MAGKQTSAAHQTMKFVYSEAVNRALRQRCRGLTTTSKTTKDDDSPPLPPELLLAVLQSGDFDFSVVAGKSAGRLQSDADTTAVTASDDVDYEISNLSEIYREISQTVEQVRRRSAVNDANSASAATPQDRPSTRTTAASKIPNTTSDEKSKPPTEKSPRQASVRTTGTDSDRRQKDAKHVQFSMSSKQESTGE